MRETTSIYRDFSTGEVKESIKIKPDGNMIGRATLSLYNCKGEKEKEVFTENVIMDIIKDNAYNFTYGMNFMGVDYGLNAYYNKSFAEYILLTSNDNDENSRKPFMNFKTVGFCGRNTSYSGNSLTQGSYNQAESRSFFDKDGNRVVHLVYDFPTHACNGEIKSIVWTKTNTGNEDNFFGIYGSSNTSNLFSTYKTTNMYLSKKSKIPLTVISHEDGHAIAEATYDTPKRRVFASLSNYDDKIQTYTFKKIGEKILLVGVSVPSHTDTNQTATVIRHWDLDGNYISELDKSFEGVNLNTLFPGKNLYSGIFYGIYTKDFITGYAHTSSIDEPVSYNTKTKVLKKIKASGSSTSSSYWSIRYYNEDTIYLRTKYCNGTYNPDFTSNPTKSVSTSDGSWCMYGMFNKDFEIIMSPGSLCYIKNGGKTVYAHTKLPIPITKTNTNTMKVQYDFIYKPSNVLDFIDV